MLSFSIFPKIFLPHKGSSPSKGPLKPQPLLLPPHTASAPFMSIYSENIREKVSVPRELRAGEEEAAGRTGGVVVRPAEGGRVLLPLRLATGTLSVPQTRPGRGVC